MVQEHDIIVLRLRNDALFDLRWVARRGEKMYVKRMRENDVKDVRRTTLMRFSMHGVMPYSICNGRCVGREY